MKMSAFGIGRKLITIFERSIVVSGKKSLIKIIL